MATKKAFSVTIRNEVITGAKIGTFKKAAGNINAIFSQWANAAAAQYVISGNRNWLDDLFQADEMRLTSGKLSAKGREVAGYIRAFSPINIAEKDENGIQTIAVKMNAKNKGVFYSLEKDKDGAKIKLDASEKPTWELTLREFVNRDKPATAPRSEVKKAATLQKQLETALAAITEGKVSGNTTEIAALAEMAEKLRRAAVAATTQANTGLEGVEPVKAEESQGVTSGKEARADVDRAKHAASKKGQLTMPITATKAKSKLAANA